MPLFQIDVEKFMAGEYWTNVYYVEAADLPAANTMAGSIAGREMTFHLETVTFTKARIRTVTQGDEIFVTRSIGMFGARDDSAGPPLPLFNVVRVDFNAASGRPSRKYYRGTLMATDVIAGFNIVEAYRAFVETNASEISDPGDFGVQLRDVDGEVLGEATAFPAIQMRQLRRGSKRKEKPVLPEEPE